MSVLIFLIPITLFLGLLGLAFFLWTLKTKQYEDLQGSANRILFDDADDLKTDSAEKNPKEKSGRKEKNPK